MKAAQKDGRFLTLDAMRGVAAYLVVIHHAFGPDAAGNPLRAGYLAVDFFFVLSGFVMSQAYDERFRLGLGFSRFASARLRRLVPTMLAGVLIGAASFYSTFHDLGMAGTLFFFAAVFMPLLGANIGIYPLNGVQWSLFFELAANAVHGGILWRLGARLLIPIALISFVVLAFGSYARGSVAVGDTTATFWLGFPRVGAGYVAGILLHRFRDRLRFPAVRPQVPVFALVLVIAIASWADRWSTEMLAVTGMPLLVLAGSFARTELPRLCDYLGRLSFPVYAVHVPILCFCAHLPHGYRLAVEMLAITAVAALVELLMRRRAKHDLTAKFREEPILLGSDEITAAVNR